MLERVCYNASVSLSISPTGGTEGAEQRETGREIPHQRQNKGVLLWGTDGAATEGHPCTSPPSAAQGQLHCIPVGRCKDKCTKHHQVLN